MFLFAVPRDSAAAESASRRRKRKRHFENDFAVVVVVQRKDNNNAHAVVSSVQVVPTLSAGTMSHTVYLYPLFVVLMLP
jgi:hypothetical protein